MPRAEPSHGIVHYHESGAGGRTWVMLDQPQRTAQLVAGLARRAAARSAA